MGLEIIEVTVMCRVPSDEAEDHIVKLRRGEERLPVPEGLRCRDAFDCGDPTNAETAVIRAGYW